MIIADIYTETVNIVPLLIPTGILTGLLAGLFGIGGGLVMVPVFFFIFTHLGMDAIDAMKLATGTSLAGMIPTAMSSVIAHHHNGNVDINTVKGWGIWIVIGVLAGAFMLTHYASPVFILLFALMMGWVSYRMLITPSTPSTIFLPHIIQRLIATMIGGLSVMLGVGGGTLSVPILHKMGHSMHHAIGTSAAFGLMIAFPGAIIMLLFANPPIDSPIGTYGAVHWLSLLFIVPLTVLFAPIGVKLGKKLDAVILKKIFAIILLITSVRMLFQAF